MPSPRAVLADIAEFKLDPTKHHHTKGGRLLPKTPAALETVTVSNEQPLQEVLVTARVEEQVVEPTPLSEETKVEEVIPVVEHNMFQDLYLETEVEVLPVTVNVEPETTTPPAIEVLPEVVVSENVVATKPQTLVVSDKKRRNQKG